jgi:lysophospholipase L1-like esterase
VALGGVAGAWRYRRTHLAASESDVITGWWPELSQTWLLPDLRAARMIVPDRPHFRAEVEVPELREKIRRRREFLVSTSRRRLRGDADSARAVALRILAVGDSVTFGWGVAETQSWPAVLAERLANTGVPVEILNAGVPAASLDCMAAWLTTVAPSLRAHAVLFSKRPHPGQGSAEAFLSALSRSRQALPDLRFACVLPPVSTFDLDGMSSRREMQTWIEARAGVPVVDLTDALLAARPQSGVIVHGTTEEHSLVDVASHAVLTTGSRSHDSPLAKQIYTILDADASLKEPFFFDDCHPDADGLSRMATEIASLVTVEGWLG